MVIKSDKTLSPFAAPAESRSSLRQALPQILAVCVKNVLLLGFGMTLGFPTILIPSLSGSDPNEPISLGQEAISWIGSINLICVPIGCLLSGAATQPIGRRRAMQLVNIPFLTAWLLFYFSTDVWQIFLALCITGVTGGLLEAPTLTYVAEITLPSLRGILSSTSGVAVICGILAQFLLGTFLNWRIVALVSVVVPIVSFFLLFFVPESPYWLILKNRHEDARKCIAWLRGWTTVEEIEPEFTELCKQISSTVSEKPTIIDKLKLFTKKNFFWPFLVVSFAFFMSQFSGTTPLQIYAVKIFATLKAPIDEYYATVAMGVAEVLGCVLSTCLVHYTGKRKMNFFSLISCGLCFLIVATYAYLHNINHLEKFSSINRSGDTSWLPMVFLITAAFCTHTGIKLLPWMLIGEVYSNETRATASGFSGAVSYVFGFISIKIFLYLVNWITLPGTFWFYCVMCFVGTIVLYFILPETEGKTLFEITEHFASNSKLSNKVTRIKDIRKGEINNAYVSNDETRV
ncbi:facilitated trehalose transporter Tret1 isoform X2 [Tribolium madens]|uniref:facilitated trehalose transporter Tret1 isoform X2 n=1 Tax=Tribolium madens TaxID=41895 RepID=UPI001CF761E4|nr:facilitated trehalose transporter Tret1 isoform X2 [Tribolium madens]